MFAAMNLSALPAATISNWWRQCFGTGFRTATLYENAPLARATKQMMRGLDLPDLEAAFATRYPAFEAMLPAKMPAKRLAASDTRNGEEGSWRTFLIGYDLHCYGTIAGDFREKLAAISRWLPGIEIFEQILWPMTEPPWMSVGWFRIMDWKSCCSSSSEILRVCQNHTGHAFDRAERVVVVARIPIWF